MSRTDHGLDGLTYAYIARHPEIGERLVREAHHARNEAIARAFAGLARAIASNARRASRIAKVTLLRAGQHVNAALGHAQPRGRRC